MFPVEVAYLKEPTPDYVREAAQVVWDINLQVDWLKAQFRNNSHHRQQNSGDILVFLTGREDIERCLEELAHMLPT
jgi:ATP-dependent RNA helicase DDX35